jgi:tetratricopeptide (TPR) repeat protein
MKFFYGLFLFALAVLLFISGCSKAPIIYSPLKDMHWLSSKDDTLNQEKEHVDDLLKEDEKLYRELLKHKTIVENAEDEEGGNDEKKPGKATGKIIDGHDDFKWYKIGYQALYDKNWKEALNAFDHAIEINPQYMEAYFHRGNVYDEMGDYEKAVVDYTRAIKLNPIYTDAYLFRGFAFNNLGKINKAIKDIKKAAKLGDQFAQKFLIKKGIPW